MDLWSLDFGTEHCEKCHQHTECMTTATALLRGRLVVLSHIANSYYKKSNTRVHFKLQQLSWAYLPLNPNKQKKDSSIQVLH